MKWLPCGYTGTAFHGLLSSIEEYEAYGMNNDKCQGCKLLSSIEEYEVHVFFGGEIGQNGLLSSIEEYEGSFLLAITSASDSYYRP